MPQPPAADNWFEWLLPELQLKILDMRIVRARELKLARHTEFQMLAVELQHSLLDEDFENLHDAATAVMGEVNAAAEEEELAAALIEATSKSDGGPVAVSAAATSLEAAQASQPQQPTPQPAPAAASAAEINDEGVEGYLEAAGFAVTPPEAQDPLACEPLDVRSLHAALEALAAAGSGRRRADGSHQAARAALDGDDVMRVYGSGPCESLVSPVAQFEFVGALRGGQIVSSGATHKLFLKDSALAWYQPFGAVLELVRAEHARLQPGRTVACGCSMGGYAAVRLGLELPFVDAVLAFAPQVLLEPAERSALQLPTLFFDRALQQLADSTVPLESLVDVAARAPPRPAAATVYRLHVGGLSSGDLKEARLFEAAVAAAAARGESGEGCGTVDVHVHPKLGHGLAIALRSTGVLSELLEKLVATS